MNLRAKTCCFTGHRSLSHEEKLKVVVRLREIIAEQIKAGVVFYGAGGARGFDTLAALTVLEMKKEYPQLRLILVLPSGSKIPHKQGKPCRNSACTNRTSSACLCAFRRKRLSILLHLFGF